MAHSSFNPLYPSNKEVSDFEESIREAELYDDTKKMEQEWKKRRGLIDENDDQLW